MYVPFPKSRSPWREEPPPLDPLSKGNIYSMSMSISQRSNILYLLWPGPNNIMREIIFLTWVDVLVHLDFIQSNIEDFKHGIVESW